MKFVENPDDIREISPKYSHDQWIEDGNCPVISLTKTWCSKDAGHDGLHYSPRIPDPNRPIGVGNHAYTEWRQ